MADTVMVEKHGQSQGGQSLGIGASVKRVEDLRLLRGLGRYTDDQQIARATHMVVVRSPVPHATISGIDTTQARAVPGVLAVLTGADVLADGLGPLGPLIARPQRDGSAQLRTAYHILATDRVRFVGDAVAVVVAETRAAAQDGADLVDVQYDDLPVVTDVAQAVRPDAPALWPDLAENNVAFVHIVGDKAATDAAFAQAAHVARHEFRVSRLSANTMEPRNAIGQYDPVEDRYTLITGTQSPHGTRNLICDQVLKIQTIQLRVVANDVGGGFGLKGGSFPEQSLVLWAAKRVGRPVRWQATRSESLIGDHHARDNATTIELALDKDGQFTGVRVRVLAALGAYLGTSALVTPTSNVGSYAGTYRTPHIHVDVSGVLTNTQPTAPYRGAGRPEATYALERVIDIAAAELGIDRVELRRRNLIPTGAMPFQTGLIYNYDSGDFAANMDMAMQAADWAGYPARLAESKARGKLRGIALVNAIEIAGGPSRTPMDEGAELRFDQGGNLTMVLGSHNHGQGHETVFRQIASSLLGVEPGRVRILFGDTELVPHGRGTFGSRTMSAGGGAVSKAADMIIERGRKLAGMMLEADEGDITFEAGAFKVAGTDRAVRIEQVAKMSYTPGRIKPGQEVGLNAMAAVSPLDATYPNGTHICEVEIDPETGVTQLQRYVVVDDVGTVINPMLVKGQVHGGVVQGISQVLFEQLVIDPESGQMVTGSFMDYAMPRADDMPMIEVASNPHPTKMNALGAKGAGEAGTVGALPVVMNAIIDALSEYGVRDLPMPATGEVVWRAIQAGKAA